MPPALLRAVAVVSVLLLASVPSAGCMRTTQFPPSEIPRLRPLMQGEPGNVQSVVLQGNYPARIWHDTDLDLVIQHRGREMRATVQPRHLGWRTDGLWVEDHYLPSTDIVGMEMTTFSLGRTIGFSLLCAAGAILTLFGTLVLVRSAEGGG